MPAIRVKEFNLGIIYFILWCVYKLQGVLYQSGGLISQSILMILLIWSIYVFLLVNRSYKSIPSFLKCLSVFIAILSVYGLVLIISGKDLYVTEDLYVRVSNFDYIKNIFISLLPIYVFYHYTRFDIITESHVRFMTIVLLIITILNFYHRRDLLIAESVTGREDFTLNVGYSFLRILPMFFFFHKKTTLQHFLFIICLAFIVLCVKRGAIIISVFCYLLFLIYNIRSGRLRKKSSGILLSIISLLCIGYFVADTMANNEYFMHRIEQTIEGDSSNRDEIYTTFASHFLSEQNLFDFLFGHGANSTLEIGRNFAHNDWLEIAINNGLIVVIVYIIFYISLFRSWGTVKNYSIEYSYSFLMSWIIMFISSFFSMSYTSVGLPIAIVIGFTLGTYKKLKFSHQ